MSNLRPAAGALACMMLTLIGCQGAAPFPTNTSADADAGSVDGGSPDGGTVDGGGGDAGGVDAGMPDAGQLDAGTPDAGQLDAGTPDAGILDAGATDAGAADAGILDAGAHDAGEVDAGTTDAGTTDAGSGPDAGPTCLPTTDYQTDSNNCGTCGNVCTITSPSTVSCVEGRCLAVLAQSPFPLAMASDDTSIYWADHGSTTPTGGAIDKIATTGGRVQTLASGLPSPSAISVDSHAVYWAENENATGTSQVGGIYSVKADGGGFGTVTGGVDYPEQVLAVEDDVFFTEISGTAQPLYLFPGSGEPAVFLNEGVAAMTSLGDTVYIVTLATFDASQPNYYDKDASLFAATAAGGITSTIATGLGYAGGIAVDGTNAYVTIPGASSGSGSLGNGEVLQISLAAGTVSTLSSGYMQAMAIASDGTDVYWTNFRDGSGSGTFVGTGSVCKVPVGGGNTITLLAGQTAPTGIEVDSTSVYWMVGSNYGGTAGSGGRVLKLTPK